MTTSGMERFTLRQRGFAVVRDQRAVTDRMQDFGDGIRESQIIFDD